VSSLLALVSRTVELPKLLVAYVPPRSVVAFPFVSVNDWAPATPAVTNEKKVAAASDLTTRGSLVEFMVTCSFSL
jgi:hypothetical protein